MNEQAKAALHTIDEKAAYFTAISDAVWDDPELSLKEFHAAALYKNALRELGFSVQENLCGIETASPGGNGHSCGHNLLGAGSLAAAAALKEYLAMSGKPGTVVFFGCPGEEGGVPIAI